MNNNLNNQKPVEFFSAERIKIEIDGQQILWRDMSLEIDSRIGEHTIGRIKYIGSVNQLSLYDALIDRKGDKEIKILGRSNITDNTGNSTEKIFLNGVIKELQINETTAGALTVEITAISKSVLLDRIPRYRSFQDPTLTYSAIAEEINGNYGTNDGKIVNVGEDMQAVPRMTIQYNETDWEYLKRIASYTGQPVMAYSDKVFVGFFKNMPAQTPNLKYSQFGKRTKEERRYFKITGTEVYPVATPIKLKTRNRVSGEEVENDYYVLENKIYNEGNTLKCEYILGKQTGYFVDPIPHEKIRGAVIEARTIHIARTDESKSEYGRTDGSSDNLEGKTIGAKPLNKYIEKTENNQNENTKEKVKTKDIAVMTLNLTEGLMDLGENGQSFEDKYAGKSYFPYVTPYSQTNTGFTPAPEVNDRVALYFPNGNETKAFIIGALNNDGNGRFTDVANRNYHVGDSDFNMVLATNSLSTSAAESISQSASNISEQAREIRETAENIANMSNNHTEIIKNKKLIAANSVSQVTQGNTIIQSNGDTEINSTGYSTVNGGANVFING
ncbi:MULTISPECIES: hypothetical protein [unclassified Leptotrichia]|jgi:hypothetical protein|uniref:hypothetical protein n=1 Tax=unclassified Leptotrichia TaxID=2633022 RepID=UPI0003AD7D63|nr:MULTISPECIES: hypothetical protein [unclassified Leptotrichia]ERL26662.1 hypothetical protein HMPREF9108_00755 [Leptotrichia sp. oral taxon 225 str. F0581]WLD75333.1 hypothetical protein QU666_05540 [Leptotrichia sp. HMT-225]